MAKQSTQVEVSKNRCPYCHDSVGVEESVACQGCLARHHEACWEESGTCGSCGHEQPLLVSRPPLDRESLMRRLVHEGYSVDEVSKALAAPEAAPVVVTAPREAQGGIAILVFVSLASLMVAVGVGVLMGQAAKNVGGWRDGDAVLLGAATGAVVFGLLALLGVRKR